MGSGGKCDCSQGSLIIKLIDEVNLFLQHLSNLKDKTILHTLTCMHTDTTETYHDDHSDNLMLLSSSSLCLCSPESTKRVCVY